jgi:hypothetical protein
MSSRWENRELMTFSSRIYTALVVLVVKWAPWFGKALLSVVTILTLLVSVITIWDRIFDEAVVAGDVTRTVFNEVIGYGGILKNVSDKHATDLTMKARFSGSKVLKVEVVPNGDIEKKLSNDGKPADSATFALDRLSSANNCSFTIVIAPNGSVSETIIVSWGKKGRLSLSPRNPDEQQLRTMNHTLFLKNTDDEYAKARTELIERDSRSVQKDKRKIKKQDKKP